MTALRGLRALVAAGNSPLAKAAFLIFGNAAALLELLLQQADRTDPGRRACEALLRDLRRDLPGHGTEAAGCDREAEGASLAEEPAAGDGASPALPAAQPVSPPSPQAGELGDAPRQPLPAPALPQTAALLQDMAARMAADQDVAGKLRTEALAEPDTPQFWQAIGLALLKIPVMAATVWRERWAATTGEAGIADAWLELPYDKDEPILDASPNRRGLRLATAARLDRRLGEEPVEPGLKLIGRITTIFLWLAENDPQAWQVFRPVNRFGPEAVNDRYTSAVVSRFAAIRRAERQGDAVAALKQRLDLDEAIHSLWASPLPDRRSRWRLLQGRLRNLLFEEERRVRGTFLRDLSGLPYQQLRKFTTDDCGIDIGSVPGEVLACLRVYATIEGENLNGRVMIQQIR